MSFKTPHMRVYHRLLNIIACMAIIVILSLSINALFWADEFFMYQQMQAKSVWGFMQWNYLNWDGRFISLNALIQLLLIKNDLPTLAVALWSLMLLLSAGFMYRIFQWEQKQKERSFGLKHLPALAFLFCLLWLGYSGHISETVYWVTGGIYTMGLAMNFGFVYMFHRRPAGIRFSWLAWGSLYGLLLGLMGVIASFPLLVFLLVEMALDHKALSHDRRRWAYPASWGFFILLGTLVNIAAPGNYVRASILDTSFQWDGLLMAVNFIKINIRYLLFSLPAIAAALAAVLFIPRAQDLDNGKWFRLSPPKVYLNIFRQPYEVLRLFKWLLVAVSGIIPMLVIPDIAGGRTSVFYMSFLFLWVWTFFHYILSVSYAKPVVRFKLPAGVLRTVVLLFFWGIILLASRQYSTGRAIRLQVQEREAYLAAMRGKTDTVSVKPIVVEEIPFAVFFHDLLDDSYAHYYGFEKVVLDTTAVDSLPGYYLEPPW